MYAQPIIICLELLFRTFALWNLVVVVVMMMMMMMLLLVVLLLLLLVVVGGFLDTRRRLHPLRRCPWVSASWPWWTVCKMQRCIKDGRNGSPMVMALFTLKIAIKNVVLFSFQQPWFYGQRMLDGLPDHDILQLIFMILTGYSRWDLQNFYLNFNIQLNLL